MSGVQQSTEQSHPHPMPGWIAVAPVPDPEEPRTGLIVVTFDGRPGWPIVVYRAIVLEVADSSCPFSEGSTVVTQSKPSLKLGDAFYMPAREVIGWED